MSVVFVSLFISYVTSQAPFTDAEINTMRGYFTLNMKMPGVKAGFVVAAPMNSNPNYYYHWQRDAGISMHTLQYTDSTTSFDSYFQLYTQWVTDAQKQNDPNGIDVLGEPKFNPDGSVFSDGWCRPQNDGPASRAIALIGYANYLLDNGKKDYVINYLYNLNDTSLGIDCQETNPEKQDCGYVGITEQECEDKGCCWKPEEEEQIPWCYYPKNGPSGPIPIDLTYVNNNWNNVSNNCDLWEEVRGPQFYTYIVQRYALLFGSKLASRLGDTDSATTWSATASTMVNVIKSFGSNGIIYEKNGRDHDCSIVVGSLYGGTPDKFMSNVTEVYPPYDKEVLDTIQQHLSYFQSTYPLNSENTNQGIKGTLVGRYANDVYTGCDNNGGSHAHAWILCTNAIADVFYRNSQYWYSNIQNVNKMDKEHLKVLSKLFKTVALPKASQYIAEYVDIWDNISRLEKIDVIRTISGIFAQSGDDQLQGVSKFVKQCNLHMSEQICEVDSSLGGGLEIGAPDLTWSYGTILSAMYYRNESIKMGVQPWKYDRNETAINILHNQLESPQENCAGNICLGQCHN